MALHTLGKSATGHKLCQKNGDCLAIHAQSAVNLHFSHIQWILNVLVPCVVGSCWPDKNGGDSSVRQQHQRQYHLEKVGILCYSACGGGGGVGFSNPKYNLLPFLWRLNIRPLCLSFQIQLHLLLSTVWPRLAPSYKSAVWHKPPPLFLLSPLALFADRMLAGWMISKCRSIRAHGHLSICQCS